MPRHLSNWFSPSKSLQPRELLIAGIAVELVRRKVKNLRLTVYPPLGRVRVIAPLRCSEAFIRGTVQSKTPWIKCQQAAILNRPQCLPAQYLNGEEHYFRGQPHRLCCTEGPQKPQVILHESRKLELLIPPGSTPAQRAALLDRWYRDQLGKLLPDLITRWEPLLKVKVSTWGIRRMKTRWGTCNTRTHRIWLNLELIKISPACLEYVVVHEMVHLLERHHNSRFYSHLDRVLPTWKLTRNELNRTMIA